MEDYKQYLSNNADEEERRAAAQVMEGLSELRLESKVREVGAERARLRRRAFWQRIFTSIVVLVLVAGATYWFLGKKETSATPSSVPQQQDQPATPPTNNPSPPEKIQDQNESKPMAQLRPAERLTNPRYAAPEATMIRGDETENKALKALLDQIWYTDYPLKGVEVGSSFQKADESLRKRDFTAAYVELERLEGQNAQNDTLRYLKGYCLLEMAEGNEALANFDPLQGRYTAWEPQLQWYRGLAMLLTDDRAKAIAVFKKIAANPKHRYYREAVKALGIMTKKE